MQVNWNYTLPSNDPLSVYRLIEAAEDLTKRDLDFLVDSLLQMISYGDEVERMIDLIDLNFEKAKEYVTVHGER